MIRAAIVATSLLVACTDAEVRDVRAVYVVRGAGFAPGALYATLTNRSAHADTVVRIDIEGATSVELHDNARSASGAMEMRPVASIGLQPGATTRLAPGGMHGMVNGLRAGLARGDTLGVTFHFARRGAIAARAQVIDYDQVDGLVGRGGR